LLVAVKDAPQVSGLGAAVVVSKKYWKGVTVCRGRRLGRAGLGLLLLLLCSNNSLIINTNFL